MSSYSWFTNSDANFTTYAPLGDTSRYVMWRFDFRLLQHSYSRLDFGGEVLYLHQPVVAENCLYAVCWDRSDPYRYPRIKYTWLEPPTLKFIALRALFASVPVEVCERWAGWARPSNAAGFLRQVCPERAGQFELVGRVNKKISGNG